jgi:hypothetical protein
VGGGGGARRDGGRQGGREGGREGGETNRTMKGWLSLERMVFSIMTYFTFASGQPERRERERAEGGGDLVLLLDVSLLHDLDSIFFVILLELRMDDTSIGTFT